MAMHTRRHTYERSQHFTSWLHGIAHYKLVDYGTTASIKGFEPEPADRRGGGRDR